MIELERHIEILLLNNDCVIVPELGGFMTHHIDAHYDEAEQLFLPPVRTLGFNPQLKINDSLLAQSYVEAYDISYPEALRRIEDEVNELRQHLQNEGSYELNDIGLLSLNDDGNYVFAPCEAGILTPELYGLSSFDFKRLHAADSSTTEDCGVRIVSMPQVETSQAANEESEEEAGVEQPFIDDEEDDDDTIRIKFSWIRNAVAVAAVLTAIFLLALPTGKTEMMTRTISNLNNTIFFGMMSKDTNMSAIDIKKCDIQKPAAKTDTIVLKDSASLPKPETQTTQEPEKKKGYCIVLASQVSKSNAETFIAYLQKKGYDKAEIYVNNNIRRVIYGNYETQAEAYNDLKEIHKNKDLAQAWIYHFN